MCTRLHSPRECTQSNIKTSVLGTSLYIYHMTMSSFSAWYTTWYAKYIKVKGSLAVFKGFTHQCKMCTFHCPTMNTGQNLETGIVLQDLVSQLKFCAHELFLHLVMIDLATYFGLSCST